MLYRITSLYIADMPSSVARTRGRQHGIALAARVFLTLLILVRLTSAQSAQQQKYVISVGTPSERLASGTLWLYSYSWYGLQHYKLAAIHNGLAVVPLDIDRLKRELDPHPNTSAYVAVVQAGEHLWFRTPDIAPDSFWKDFPGALTLLGSSTELPTGETQLVLAKPAKRHVTFLYPDGRPKANFDLNVSIYLWDQNHCGVHEGLPLGTFRTDAEGTIEVPSPLVPLYFDGLEYYAFEGDGPAGLAYSGNDGMKISADEAVVVNVAWEVPEFEVQLHVLSPSGQPRPGMVLFENRETNTCGGAYDVAKTDASGTVRLKLDATVTLLTLRVGGPYAADDPAGDRNTRELTDAELGELFSKHDLTIRW